MKLFHGSNVRIDEIVLSKSKPFKDFGKGFYLSGSYEQAYEWAVFRSKSLGGKPTVTSFEVDEDIMEKAGLNVKCFTGYSEEWLDFVIANRSGEPTEAYDIVFGPIADDNVGLQIRRWFEGGISKKELLRRLKYRKGITYQYFFGTQDAIDFLTEAKDERQ